MTRQIPDTITAGDTLLQTITSADYPSTDGWDMCFALRGKIPSDHTLTANADGSYTLSIAASATRLYQEGTYRYVVYVASNTEQYTVEDGYVDVVARADLIRTIDVRTHAQKVLDAINATIEGRATSDQLAYTIGNRSLQRTPLLDLLKLQEVYEEKVMKEQEQSGQRTTKNKVKYVLRND